MSTPQTENSSRVCEVCRIEKPENDFYRIADKQRGTIRVEKYCKACKVRFSLERKAKIKAIEKAASIVPPIVVERPPLHQESSPPSTHLREIPEPTGHAPKKYTHPNYEDWEVAQAIEVFQILLRKRDEARKKGLINW